jgi:hypothetical protein
MIVQFIHFETSLSEKELLAVAEERLPQFRAIPSVVQKYYLKLDKPNHYGGFYIGTLLRRRQSTGTAISQSRSPRLTRLSAHLTSAPTKWSFPPEVLRASSPDRAEL